MDGPPACKRMRFYYFGSDDGWTDESSSDVEYTIVYDPLTEFPPASIWGVNGLNLQYPLSKKIWLMLFFSRVHYGWLYNYRHIPKMIFFLLGVEEGTYEPNLICYWAMAAYAASAEHIR